MLLVQKILEWCQENMTILLCVAGVVVAFLIIVIALSVSAKRKKKKVSRSDKERFAEVAPALEEGEKQLAEQPAEEVVAEEEKPAEQPAEEVVAEEEQPAEQPVEEVVAEEEQPAEQPVEEVVAEEEKPAEQPAEEEPEEEDEDDGDDNFADEDEEEEEGISLVQEGGIKVVFRYQYSFMARLIQSPEEVQRRYGELRDFIASYDRAKTNLSWKQVRVYTGRKTLAMILFKGRKLCISFALDAQDYDDTKYRLIDVSDIKRFEKTPSLMKLTSPRKVKYAKELLAAIFEEQQLIQGEVVPTEYRLPYQTTEELININLVKLLSNRDKVHSSQMIEPISISEMIRDRITLREAELMVSDEVAAAVYEQSKAETQTTGEERAVKRSVPRSLKGEINIDTLSENFKARDVVTLEVLKEKKLVPQKVEFIKILARGVLDKPLTIVADDFSLNAVKMIMLTGGTVRIV